MARRIIVCGASTAGKSTFSRLLVERYAVDHYELDPIISAFQSVYPDLGISHDAPDHGSHMKVCEALAPFLTKMIGSMTEDDFVIEGFRMPLQALYRRFEGEKFQWFAFGFPGMTVEAKFKAIRKFDGAGNWTGAESDASLKKTIGFLIRESRYLETACRRVGVPFFDTGKDYWKGIEEAMGRVK